MILHDETLLKYVLTNKIEVSPLPSDDQFQPSSIDLSLDYYFTSYKYDSLGYIDTKDPYLNLEEFTSNVELKHRYERFVLQPNDFVLAQTIEKVQIPSNIVGIVEGRSSFGRLGLLVHATAGYIDPGFEGNITLELKNINNIPIAIYPEQHICQIVFYKMDGHAKYLYGCEKLKSKYQFQNKPTVSLINTEENL